MISEKIRIGYWRQTEDSNEDLPWPVIRKISPETKELVLKFLRAGIGVNHWKGWSNCRICGKMNGDTCLSNGGFVYPEGYAHYIEEHDVMPDSQLLVKLLNSNK